MLNETLIATRVLEQVGASEDELPFSRIISQIPTAIDRLGEKLAAGLLPEHIESLRREEAVTAVNGEADISTLFASDVGFISTAIRLAKVYQGTDTVQSEWEADRESVELMARSGFPVVAREGSLLIFGDSAGGVGTLNASVKIRGLAIPISSSGEIDIPKPVESELTNELAQIFMPAKATT